MFAIRNVEPADLEIVCAQRERMFEEAGIGSDALGSMTGAFRQWLQSRLADRTYFGFIVEDRGSVIGGVGLMVIDWPPHPLHPLSAQRGYVLNVFVEPSHRSEESQRS